MTNPGAAVPVTLFKRDFNSYAAEVRRGKTILVTSYGRPIGQFGPAVARAGILPAAPKPPGVLAILGLFDDWTDIKTDMAAVVASRRRGKDRRAPSFS